MTKTKVVPLTLLVIFSSVGVALQIAAHINLAKSLFVKNVPQCPSSAEKDSDVTPAASDQHLLDSAKDGVLDSQLKLAAKYDIIQNFKDALFWYRKAGDQRSIQAQLNAASILVFLDRESQTNDNASESFMWNRRAADQGNATGQVRTAVSFIRGVGVHRNTAIGIGFLEKAATQQDVLALFYLAQFYERGVGGVRLDTARARRLYGQAADLGYEPAQIALVISRRDFIGQ